MLDTNIPSELLRAQPDKNVLQWTQGQVSRTLFVSVITIGELRRGTALLMENSERRTSLERLIEGRIPAWFGNRILPVNQMIAERWGSVDALRQLAGKPLNIADGLIAATAMEHDMVLVTRNVRDFADLGIQVLNPWQLV